MLAYMSECKIHGYTKFERTLRIETMQDRSGKHRYRLYIYRCIACRQARQRLRENE